MELEPEDFDYFDIDVTYEQAIEILKSCLSKIEIRGEYLYKVKKAIIKILDENNKTENDNLKENFKNAENNKEN